MKNNLPHEADITTFGYKSESVTYIMETFFKAAVTTASKHGESVAQTMIVFNEEIEKSYNIHTVFSADVMVLLTREMLANQQVMAYIFDTICTFKLLLGSEYCADNVVEWIADAYSSPNGRAVKNSLLPDVIPNHVLNSMFPSRDEVISILNTNFYIVYFILTKLM